MSENEADAVCKLPLDNPRQLLTVLLGLCCGMRRGEIRGLKWGDIADGKINIRHNWIDGEGTKAPKCNSFRVFCYNEAVVACLDAVRKISRHIGENDLVLESIRTDGSPVKDDFPNKALVSVLASIGITPEEQILRRLSLHALRHTFISHLLHNGIDSLTVQYLAGHHSVKTQAIYTHVEPLINHDAVLAAMPGAPKQPNGREPKIHAVA